MQDMEMKSVRELGLAPNGPNEDPATNELYDWLVVARFDMISLADQCNSREIPSDLAETYGPRCVGTFREPPDTYLLIPPGHDEVAGRAASVLARIHAHGFLDFDAHINELDARADAYWDEPELPDRIERCREAGLRPRRWPCSASGRPAPHPRRRQGL